MLVVILVFQKFIKFYLYIIYHLLNFLDQTKTTTLYFYQICNFLLFFQYSSQKINFSHFYCRYSICIPISLIFTRNYLYEIQNQGHLFCNIYIFSLSSQLNRKLIIFKIWINPFNINLLFNIVVQLFKISLFNLKFISYSKVR